MGTPRRKNEASWLRTGSGTRETSIFPARFSSGRVNRRGAGCPRNSGTPRRRSEASWLRAGSGTREESSLPARPACSWLRFGQRAGSRVSMEWVHVLKLFYALRTCNSSMGHSIPARTESVFCCSYVPG